MGRAKILSQTQRMLISTTLGAGLVLSGYTSAFAKVVKVEFTAVETDVVVDNKLSTTTIEEPELSYFRNGLADAWVVAYNQVNSFSNDLQYWMTTAQSVHSAYVSYASLNSTDSPSTSSSVRPNSADSVRTTSPPRACAST